MNLIISEKLYIVEGFLKKTYTGNLFEGVI